MYIKSFSLFHSYYFLYSVLFLKVFLPISTAHSSTAIFVCDPLSWISVWVRLVTSWNLGCLSLTIPLKKFVNFLSAILNVNSFTGNCGSLWAFPFPWWNPDGPVLVQTRCEYLKSNWYLYLQCVPKYSWHVISRKRLFIPSSTSYSSILYKSSNDMISETWRRWFFWDLEKVPFTLIIH